MRVLHVISGLGRGGAERVLVEFVRETTDLDHHVISLTGRGPLANDLEAAGAAVLDFSLSATYPNPFMIFRLNSIMRKIKPVVVHTWMYHSDLFGGLAARFAGNRNVLWHVHTTNLDPKVDKLHTRIAVRICGILSRVVPRKIVFCSKSSMEYHKLIGYDINRGEIVSNGFQLDHSIPDRGHVQSEMKKEFGIPENAKVVAHVAGFRPQKDHETLLKAIKQLVHERPDIHFLLCGPGVDLEDPQFKNKFGSWRIPTNVHVLGLVDDVGKIQSAADCLVLSSSHGEAFPLVLGEAMARGTPCVTTDVGDAAYLVGDTGRVVPTKDPKELMRAVKMICSMPQTDWNRLSEKARERIATNFTLERSVSRLREIYSDLAPEDDGGQAIGDQSLGWSLSSEN